MDEDTAKLYGRVMVLEEIFKGMLTFTYGHMMDPVAGIAILEGHKGKMLLNPEEIFVPYFDRDIAKVVEESFRARAEEIFAEVIADIRKERGLPSEQNPPSGRTPSQGGGKAH